MKKILFLSVVVAMLVLLSAANSQASVATPNIGFNPAAQDVALGSPAYVNLYFSQVTDLFTLGTFDLDITFDPTILSFGSVTFGDPILGDQLDILGLGSVTGFDDSIPGVVNLFEISLDDPLDLEDFQAGSFILASLTFDTLSIGTSPLDISINALGDAYGDPLSADLYSGSVNVVGIPEPATLLLLGSSLAGIGIGVLRKKFAKKIS